MMPNLDCGAGWISIFFELLKISLPIVLPLAMNSRSVGVCG
jgi:hypothetical protein